MFVGAVHALLPPGEEEERVDAVLVSGLVHRGEVLERVVVLAELRLQDDALPASEVLDPLRFRAYLEERTVGPGAVAFRAFAPVAVKEAHGRGRERHRLARTRHREVDDARHEVIAVDRVAHREEAGADLLVEAGDVEELVRRLDTEPAHGALRVVEPPAGLVLVVQVVERRERLHLRPRIGGTLAEGARHVENVLLLLAHEPVGRDERRETFVYAHVRAVDDGWRERQEIARFYNTEDEADVIGVAVGGDEAVVRDGERVAIADGASLLGMGEDGNFGAVAIVEDEPPEVLV